MATASASHFSREGLLLLPGLPALGEGGAQDRPGGGGYGAAMHLKWLQWGQSVPLHVAVSLHAWLPGEGRGPRGEAETVTRAGAGNRQPGLSQGDGAETGGRALHRGRRWPLSKREARWPGGPSPRQGTGVSRAWRGPRTVHRAAVISVP